MTTRRLSLTALVLLLAWALAVPAVHGQEEKKRIVRSGPSISVFGQEIEIPANEVHRDPVVCIGCVARIQGEVRDNVVVVFGELELDGAEIGQNVVGVFSKIRVRDSYIEDTLVNALGSLDRDNVSGNVVNIGLPFGWAPRVHTILFWFRAVGLLLAFIALVGAVSVAPERVEVIGREAPVRYFSAFFVGLIGYPLTVGRNLCKKLIKILFRFPRETGHESRSDEKVRYGMANPADYIHGSRSIPPAHSLKDRI